MQTVAIGEAQLNLAELIDSAAAGEEIVITRDERPVAKLTGANSSTSFRAITPSSVGSVLRPLSTDVDDVLDEMLDR